jgi:hypothetical protein
MAKSVSLAKSAAKPSWAGLSGENALPVRF